MTTDRGAKGAAARELVAAITSRIVQRVHPLRVVLFGSQARGQAGRSSDLDLLVVIARPEDRPAAAREARKAVHELDLPIGVDVVVASADEVRRRGALVGTVLRPALREGQVLYDAADAVDLEVQPVADSERLTETRRWLQQADEDLRAAEELLRAPEPTSRPASYLAQQGAEKALKAVLVFLQIDYPFTHELGPILNRIPSGWQVKELPIDLRWLSQWSYRGRYPGDWTPPSVEDARAAAEEARSIWRAVAADLQAHGLPDAEA